MRAIRFYEHGSPDVLRVAEVPKPDASPGQVSIEVTAAAVHFADILVRRGGPGMPAVPLPFVPGFTVTGIAAGRRVVAAVASGGYAERAAAAADAVVPIPDGLDDATALAAFGHGGAALGIVEAAGLRAGETVLITAAAGGVGNLMVQLAARAGASVIGAVGGPDKLAAVPSVAVDYARDDWPDRVRELAPDGVHAVLDTVGGPIAETAFGLLTPRTGRIVLAGLSGGAAPRLDSAAVLARGITVTGFASVLDGARERSARARHALDLAAAGELRPIAGAAVPLDAAAGLHRAVEARQTTGTSVLVVAQRSS